MRRIQIRESDVPKRNRKRPRTTNNTMEMVVGKRRKLFIPPNLRGAVRQEGLLNLEKKYLDTIIGFVNVKDEEQFMILNGVVQGTDVSERIGTKITVVSIHLRYMVNWGDTDDALDSTVRVILLLDSQCNGAVPTSNTILEQEHPRSFNNIEHSMRYRVLKDEIIDAPLGSVYENATPAVVRHIPRTGREWHQKVNTPIMFSGPGGVVADVRSNNFVLMVLSDQTVNGTSVSGWARIRYTDG